MFDSETTIFVVQMQLNGFLSVNKYQGKGINFLYQFTRSYLLLLKVSFLSHIK
jgi:hypothetical protein